MGSIFPLLKRWLIIAPISTSNEAEELNPEPLGTPPSIHASKPPIVQPSSLRREQIPLTRAADVNCSLLSGVREDKSTSNPEIDEIDVAAWYDEASVEKSTCLAYVWWSPNGDWGSAHGDIAESNDRQSYLITFEINIDIKPEEVKYGLTEQERKQVFYDLVALQDKISFDDPDYDEKIDQANETVASQYGLTVEQVKDIGFEGSFNGWPMPDLE